MQDITLEILAEEIAWGRDRRGLRVLLAIRPPWSSPDAGGMIS